MEEIINQYGKVIIPIIAVVALVAVISFLILGGDANGNGSVVSTLFTNLLEGFTNKANSFIEGTNVGGVTGTILFH